MLEEGLTGDDAPFSPYLPPPSMADPGPAGARRSDLDALAPGIDAQGVGVAPTVACRDQPNIYDHKENLTVGTVARYSVPHGK